MSHPNVLRTHELIVVISKKRFTIGHTTGSIGSLFIRLFHCSRFCSGRASKLQRSSPRFNNAATTSATAITWNQRISTDFTNVRNLVRDHGVGGSNPLSPTNCFQALAASTQSPKPTPWFCPRFHHVLKRFDPHKYCTSCPGTGAAPSTKSTTAM